MALVAILRRGTTPAFRRQAAVVLRPQNVWGPRRLRCFSTALNLQSLYDDEGDMEASQPADIFGIADKKPAKVCAKRLQDLSQMLDEEFEAHITERNLQGIVKRDVPQGVDEKTYRKATFLVEVMKDKFFTPFVSASDAVELMSLMLEEPDSSVVVSVEKVLNAAAFDRSFVGSEKATEREQILQLWSRAQSCAARAKQGAIVLRSGAVVHGASFTNLMASSAAIPPM
jgi:hypothetical protein